MNIITLNNSNIVDKVFNNRLIYRLNKDLEIDKYKISLFSFSIPNSIPNISSIYNNNTFQIIYNNITYNYEITEGFYTVSSLNNYFKYIQKETLALPYNVIDGDDTYFFEIVENSTFYSVQLMLRKATLAGTAGHQTAIYTNKTFQLRFNSKLAEFLGFVENNLYPPTIQTTDYVRLSKDENLIPNLTPVYNLNFNINVVTNEFSQNTATIYSFTPLNVEYGGLMYHIINPPLFFKTSARVDRLELQILDQNSNKIKFLDSNMNINLLIEKL